LDGAQIGNSAEFFLDASAGTHLRFVDAVIALAQANAPVFGYMGIRFMPQSAALIGMPRFALCASVEVSTSRSRLEDVLARFWTEVHALANASGAVAHWGQEELRQSQNDIVLRFGLNLATWRRHWAAFAGGSSTFSTEFSRVHGLERDHMFVPDDGRQMRGMSSSRNANMRSA
jgi:hypothetical protein